MPGIDLNHWERTLESAKKQLMLSDVSGEDKKLILDFCEKKRLSRNVGAGRRLKYVNNLMVASRRLRALTKKGFRTAKKTDIELLVKDLYDNSSAWNIKSGSKLSDGTIWAHTVILKSFYTWLKDDPKNKEASWITPKRVEAKRLRPDEIITWEDALLLSKAGANHRDKALPLVLLESGVRVGELLTMSIKDVELQGKGAIMHLIDSKTDIRDIGLVKSVPALKEWLINHPLRDNPDAPLWTNLKGDRASGGLVRRILQKQQAKAKLKKKINPHLFRKSSATTLAHKGTLSELELKKRFGWTPDSRMLKTYVHLDDKEINRKYFASVAEGVKCSSCQEINTSGDKYCSCGFPLSEDLIVRKNDLERYVEELIERRERARAVPMI